MECDLTNYERTVRVVLNHQKEPSRWAKVGIVKDGNGIALSFTDPTIKSKP
nr:MAG TPA: hypothetical protein [Caudoviricetes sp.]